MYHDKEKIPVVKAIFVTIFGALSLIVWSLFNLGYALVNPLYQKEIKLEIVGRIKEKCDCGCGDEKYIKSKQTKSTEKRRNNMKNIISILVVLFLTVTTTLPAMANNIKKEMGDVKYDRAVENLLIGANSVNDGLRKSSIHMLGQMEAEDAVIPLMLVLHSDTNEKSRIAAAWALCKIGDSRGTYAVKQAVRFDESLKVRMHCAWYYNLYVIDGTFAFNPAIDSPLQIAEMK